MLRRSLVATTSIFLVAGCKKEPSSIGPGFNIERDVGGIAAYSLILNAETSVGPLADAPFAREAAVVGAMRVCRFASKAATVTDDKKLVGRVAGIITSVARVCCPSPVDAAAVAGCCASVHAADRELETLAFNAASLGWSPRDVPRLESGWGSAAAKAEVDLLIANAPPSAEQKAVLDGWKDPGVTVSELEVRCKKAVTQVSKLDPEARNDEQMRFWRNNTIRNLCENELASFKAMSDATGACEAKKDAACETLCASRHLDGGRVPATLASRFTRWTELCPVDAGR